MTLEAYEHEGQEGICISQPREPFTIVPSLDGGQILQLLHPEGVKLYRDLAEIYGPLDRLEGTRGS